jgi:hypothetical protein
MSDDIVERLRQQATIEAKKFGDAADIQLEWKAAAEIARLRARVEVLEAALNAIFPDGANIKLVPKANAEEAKP